MDGTSGLLVNTDMETKAERYRQRAVELRAIAEAVMDLKARATLLDVAQDYERMANSAENTMRGVKSDGVDQPERSSYAFASPPAPMLI